MTKKLPPAERTASGLLVTRPRIPADAMTGCIAQINERTDRQTCFLTSVLNGLVVRGALTTEAAQHAQNELTTSGTFDNQWVGKRDGSGARVWDNNAAQTRRAIGDVLGVEPDIREVPREKLAGALAAGRAVVVADELHARMAFQSGETTAAVFDAARATDTGEFNLDHVSGLHIPARPNIVVV